MIDRLSEIKLLTDQAAQISAQRMNTNMEIYEDGNSDEEGIDDLFMEYVKSVRSMINVLNNNNTKMQELKAKYIKAIKSTQEKNLAQELKVIIKENQNLHKKLKDNLNKIEKCVKQAEKEEPDEPETKMKINFYANLNLEVSKAVQKQQQNQDQFKNTVSTKIVRQVKLIDNSIDDKQAQQYMKNPELAQEMIQRKMYGNATISLQNAVTDIQDKFRDIKLLETSVMQCVELFNQLSVLVYAQGEKIDDIEANVSTSKDYVQKAQKKLVAGKQQHKKSKRCKCILIILLLVLLIIVIIVVTATTGNNNN